MAKRWYRECDLRQGDHKAVAYLPEAECILGARLVLPEVSGEWRIVGISASQMTEEKLRIRKAGERPIHYLRIELAA